MTIKWERFAGSTDTFAVRIAFIPDPDAGAAADSEDAASWGAFQLWVGGQNLCAHVDQGEVLQSAHWYLLPLLEWLVDNWNALFHEERLPHRNSAQTAVAALNATRVVPALVGETGTVAREEEWHEWWTRHALRAARSGGLLPNIVIRRLRDLIEVSWDDEPIAGTPTGFRFSAANGVALVEPEYVAKIFFEIAGAVADYLTAVDIGGERVAALREQIGNLRFPDQQDRRLNWLAGLREFPPLTGRLQGTIPVQEMQNRWNEIVETLRGTGGDAAAEAALAVEESPLVISGSCHASLLFSSLSPAVTRHDVRTLASVLIDQYRSAGDPPRLDAWARQTLLDPVIPAWEQGYELAEMLHAELDLDLSACWVDVEGLLADLDVIILSRKLEDRSVRACCMVGPHHAPTVVLNEFSPYSDNPNAQRFSLAHELCHLMYDQSHGQKLAIASGSWAPKGIERRANAFAAMFLMPPELVQRAAADVADPISDLAGVSAVANKLHVSRLAAIDHLYNMTLMSESDRDELRRQAEE